MINEKYCLGNFIKNDVHIILDDFNKNLKRLLKSIHYKKMSLVYCVNYGSQKNWSF